MIVDTSILISAERGAFDLVAFLDSIPAERLAISAITVSELHVGILRANSERRKQERIAYVNRVLSEFEVIPFDASVARKHAELLDEIRRAGHTIGANDLLIAATAVFIDSSVATLNVSEFRLTPGLTVIDASEFRL